MSMRIGVTGASGYVGQALVAHARAQGHAVVAIGRRAARGAIEHRHADLAQSLPPGLLDGLDAVVHLAADTTGGSLAVDDELRFATGLAGQAAERRLPLLVISSQAASAEAPSGYGRTKAAIEQAVLPLGAVIVRPGLVYGGTPQALYGLLVGIARRLPVVPDLLPRPAVQPIHVDDLAAVLLAALTSHYAPGRTWVAAGPAVSFGDFLSAVARHRLRSWRPRVPVPVSVLRAMLSLASVVAGPRISPARLDSLVHLQPLDAEADLRLLGIHLRPLADGLSSRGRGERRLLEEGHALMRAFLGRSPDRFAVRRYAQAIRALDNGRALPLRRTLLAYPALIGALDTPAFRRNAGVGTLGWRYGVAIRIAETRKQRAAAFLPVPGRAGLLRAIADVLRAGARELRARLLHPLAQRWGTPRG